MTIRPMDGMLGEGLLFYVDSIEMDKGEKRLSVQDFNPSSMMKRPRTSSFKKTAFLHAENFPNYFFSISPL